MNYILQLNAFYRLLPSNSVNSTAQCLYCYLMHRNSELGWIDKFTLTNIMISGYTGLSLQQIKTARTELINKGYIEYKRGTGNQCGTYSIVCLVPQSVPQSVPQNNHSEYRSPYTLYKQKENKTKQNYIYTPEKNNNFGSRIKKSSFNNYDDPNNNDYTVLEEEILDRILAED